ncbi:MAG: hypothetical protein HC878_20640 [Leptolyngbyaceae cyanobacterium SL_5_14]|nr:hypothetical protein [Leptolyngbyaceae cyanobacterium SL_5_14]
MSDAFQLGRGFQRRCPAAVLLLDDVYTTGATARSAAQALQHCGIEVVGLAAIAKPIMKDDSQSDRPKRPMKGA